jgi:hypothetical protein
MILVVQVILVVAVNEGIAPPSHLILVSLIPLPLKVKYHTSISVDWRAATEQIYIVLEIRMLSEMDSVRRVTQTIEGAICTVQVMAFEV